MTTSSQPLEGTKLRYFPLAALNEADVARLPTTVKILLEGLLRERAAGRVSDDHVAALAHWPARPARDGEVPFKPARILMQDFTGVPAIVDLAAMRDAMRRAGKDAAKVNPLIPVDLVVDHSVQVDVFGVSEAYERNLSREYQRNGERYALFKWAQGAFDKMNIVPPGMGICHQVNLERLSRVVQVRDGIAIPDTLLGTDSHTTMVNGLGVLGWGVGGIEAEAALLGQPMYLPWPEVIGVKFTGKLPTGTTATDLVLTMTELFRKRGVVNKFIEFCGSGLSNLSVADRATLSNMTPEYGATASLFPIDAQTLRYLESTGREPELLALVERYAKAQGMFRTDDTPMPSFDELIEVDLGKIEPSLAGPKRPQDRATLGTVWDSFVAASGKSPSAIQVSRFDSEGGAANEGATGVATAAPPAQAVEDGSVVIAAITSCTNTSNPSVMVAAGLLAKKAVERGLATKQTVKTSLAPGSRVVTDYLDASGLTPYLEKLGFFLVGYGCTTCIASGTPVLEANGTSRRIEDLPEGGGALLFGPAPDGGISIARQAATIARGAKECVELTLQDGRSIVCTADHKVLLADGRWRRADEVEPGRDDVVVGLEAPLDVPSDDETGYELRVGRFRFSMESRSDRLQALAFARLVGHLLSDGSISTTGQARLSAGQAVDREAMLNDIEVITGKRPAGTRYDERKWSIVLPSELSEGVASLAGVRVGRRTDQPPQLPAFILDPLCPVSVVREFLGGLFGADGHGPVLHRWGKDHRDASLGTPAYSQAVRPEFVVRQREVMVEILALLSRCGVRSDGARVYEYPVRRSASTYPAATDKIPRTEVRLTLPDGLSFVTTVGYRYCVDKALRASAAAVYWRTIDRISRQRRWMADRVRVLHALQPGWSFSKVRAIAARELEEREVVVFPHYSTLLGNDRFDRLPTGQTRFRPLHRDNCDFPSPLDVFWEIGAREWFANLNAREEADFSKRYCVGKDSLTLPAMGLKVIARRPAGERDVFDLSVDDVHAFIAGTVAVHNCIGQSGPLADPSVETAVKDGGLNVVAVLSGNRNFEGRIHPLVRSSYLASPPLVVAFALAGTVRIDLTKDPLGRGKDGKAVYLRDIWPSQDEVESVIRGSLRRDMFEKQYARISEGDEHWQKMAAPTGARYAWDKSSTYVQEPPFFQGFATQAAPLRDVESARALLVLGDSVTTDHISPAGSIAAASPAGQYLVAHDVVPLEFNSYGTRRGNHEVLVRGTFANIRLRNKLVPDKEGWWTRHLPSHEVMSVYDASLRYQHERVPLLVIAGKEYGSGSSRDWAAKGPALLGVRAVLAESYERIHRSNLVGMGILPLQFESGASAASLGLTGEETFTIRGLDRLVPRQTLTVEAVGADGSRRAFPAIARVDNATELEYLRNGGILPLVLRQLIRAN